MAAWAVASLLLSGCGQEPVADPAPASTALYGADGSWLASTVAPPQPPNLIILLIDTLRADAAGMGPDEGVMPALSAFSDQGICFRQASSSSSWTVPAVASLLTGLLPHEHGCVDPDPSPRLQESVVTYAEVLRRAYGYQTAAFTDAPWFRGSTGSLLQGFEAGSAGAGARLSRTRPKDSGFWLQGADAVLEPWMKKLDSTRPFFLFLHTFDVHDPYGEVNKHRRVTADEESWRSHDARVAGFDTTQVKSPLDTLRLFLTDSAARGALMRTGPAAFMTAVSESMWSAFRDGAHRDLASSLHGSYLDGARWTDSGLERALAWMRGAGLIENTLIVVAADHGEAFAEHGTVGHGHHLYDELVRVPLVMAGPGPFSAARSVDVSVGLIDILPTFFDWAGLADIPARHGRSLMPLVLGQAQEGHAVQAEVLVRRRMVADGADQHLVSLRSEQWKYIATLEHETAGVREELYDLRADPDELQNLLLSERLADLPVPEAFCRELAITRAFVAAEFAAWQHGARSRGEGGPGGMTSWSPGPSPCDVEERR